MADFPLDNISISSQHAVVQFRKKLVENKQTMEERMVVKPYLIDLESTNGTKLNGQKIEPARYYELMNKDMI